jgi:hypothetical protein
MYYIVAYSMYSLLDNFKKPGAYESPAILATLAYHLKATRNAVITDWGHPRGALALVLIAVCRLHLRVCSLLITHDNLYR